MREMETYYKTTKRNGMSFHGNTKYEVGKTVSLKECKNPQLCSSDVLHSSKEAIDALSYANSLDCNLYVVEGKSVVSDSRKDGFFSLHVLREVPDTLKDDIYGFRYNEALRPINPMEIQNDVTDNDIELLKAWASVSDSVRDSVGDLVWNSVRDSVKYSVWASIFNSVGDSVGDSVWNSVGDSVRYSVWTSFNDSVSAYIGSLFPNIQKWKYNDHEKDTYPYQPAVDLWKRGFVPVKVDGKWHLYGWRNGKATSLYEED